MTITEQKILTGIKYFIANTKNVGCTKLFKLLYFWDFMHFKKYGLSVTGYEYHTYPFGPVPFDLFKMIKEKKLPEEWKNEIVIIKEKTESEFRDECTYYTIKLKKRKIDLDILSPNEQAVLENVAEIFRDVKATEISDISHLPNQPWDTTLKRKGMNKVIDYFLAIDNETPLDKETIEERFKLQRELLASGRI